MHETSKLLVRQNQRQTRQKGLAAKLHIMLPAKNKLLITSCPPFRGLGGKKLQKMKKQILFLAMFTVAMIFAGTNKVFGQLLPGLHDPRTAHQLTCYLVLQLLNHCIHLPGVPYTLYT